MARGVAHLYVNEAGVQSFLAPGQPVDELIWKVSRDTGAIAREVTAPVRSGRMRNSIQANRPARTGPYQNMARVFVKIGYGIYVHEGTDRIYAAAGSYLTIPRQRQHSPNYSGGTLRKMWKGGEMVTGSKKPYFTARSVSGQRANPFLEEALNMAMPR